MPQGRPTVRIGSIAFEYEQPDIMVDTAARTSKHQVLDREVSTVIQDLGTKPTQVQIQGIATTEEAMQIDKLTGEKTVTIRSNRWSGEVNVADTTTAPKRAKNADQKWLYAFTITCNEVKKTYDGSSVSSTGGGGGGGGGGSSGGSGGLLDSGGS